MNSSLMYQPSKDLFYHPDPATTGSRFESMFSGARWASAPAPTSAKKNVPTGSGALTMSSDNGSTTCTLNPVPKSEWSGCGWRFIEAIFKASSDCDAKNLETYMNAMAQILPCMTCRTDMQKFITANPMSTYFSSFQGRQKWLSMFKEAAGGTKASRKKYIYWVLGIVGAVVAVALVLFLLRRRG